MIRRLVPIVLLLWLAIGLVTWIAGSDDAGDEVDVDDPSRADVETQDEAGMAPLSATQQAETAPGLAPGATAESAAALMARLGRDPQGAQSAEITAWLRAHPERVRELVAALVRLGLNPPSPYYTAFFRDVFAPLRDLEARLAPGLLESLTDPAPPDRPNFEPPALAALASLAPLSPGTRRALEAWIRGHPADRSRDDLARLLLADAEDGEEIRSFVQWGLTGEGRPDPASNTRHVMRLIERMGARGRGLTDLVAEHILAEHIGCKESVEALIAIAPDDPRAHRALVGRLATGGPGFVQAYTFVRARDDQKEMLLRALGDDDPRVRWGAIGHLTMNEWASREQILAALLRSLTEEDALWRDKAMSAIPQEAQNAEEVVPTLEAMFRSQHEWQWQTAARTLQRLATWGRGRKFDVAQALREALRHDNVGVRRVLVLGLKDYPATAALPLLREALDDEDAQVRSWAADGLGELAQEHAEVRAALEAAASHRDPRVAEVARAWLEEIEHQAALRRR